MSVVLSFASLPNWRTYSSPIRSCIASMPPRSVRAPPTLRRPSAVAVATARIAAAWPSASLICCCLLASDALMTRCLSPSAWLILASRSPSDASTTARFSRSARICFSIGPLRPRCERWGDRRDQADYDGRAADEDEVELRVHQGQLRPEKYRAGDYPAPPAHLGALVVSGARAPSAIFQLYTEAAVRRSTHGLVDEASSPDR